MGIGFTPHGTVSKKKRIFWELQMFAKIRNFSDGITFFRLNINYDTFESEHSPAFQLEITLFNFYNHIWIYQNNNENSD
jgi:hypothetical protein